MEAKMATLLLLFFSLFSTVSGNNGGILTIHYPDVSIEADTNGSITVQSGADASVYLIPGPGGSVFFEGTDILQLIKVINTLPPVWKPHSSVGFFKTVFGGDTISVPLEAIDSENRPITYSVVAGTIPLGLHINGSRITGTVPDRDALYSFTVRATNDAGKYADTLFRMEIIERNQCLPTNPCRHGGTCTDGTDDVAYTCTCPQAYRGKNCEIACETNSLGVDDSSIVPDSMMSGYMTVGNSSAPYGRYSYAGQGWCGVGTTSWLQIDFDKEVSLFSVKEKGYDSNYYTGSYEISYSVDGIHFQYVLGNTGGNSTAHHLFTGSSSSSPRTESLPSPVTARFVRLHPKSFSSSHSPCMRVDLRGCYL